MDTITAADARYTRVAIFLHWALAVLIALNFIFIWVADDAPKPEKMELTHYHMANGLLILALTVLRILWRVTHRAPPYVDTLKAWEVALAKVVNFLFYFVMLAIPLVGWSMVSAFGGGKPISFFGLFDIPGLPFAQSKATGETLAEVHELFAYLLLILFALHVVAALKHHFIDRDGTMRRIVSWMN